MSMMTLRELYTEHSGKVSDKWSAYLVEYDSLFEPYRVKPINLLEIGVQNGGSLEIWSKFFPDARNLVGCDINPDCRKLRYSDPRISVVVGDANTSEVEALVTGFSSTFDVIVDDGSHRSDDIIRSFARYFPYVADGGVFVVEDLHCSYWKDYEGGLFHPLSSISFFKRLADVVSHEHWGIERPRSDVLRSFFAEYCCSVGEDILAQIHSVEFRNSICVVRKKTASRNELGPRVVVGALADVCPVVRDLSGTISASPDQSRNPWAESDLLPEEELAKLKADLIERESKLLKLTDALVERDSRISELNQGLRSMLASRSWRLTQPLRWMGFHVRQFRAPGLLGRSKVIFLKSGKIIAGAAIGYVKARPVLRQRVFDIASRMGVLQSLRRMYGWTQRFVADAVIVPGQPAVFSYPAWSVAFDTPRASDLDCLRNSANLVDPVVVVARFDADSQKYAVELARRLQESVGQRWTAVFAFAPGENATQVMRDVRRVTKDDPRFSFSPQEVAENGELVVLIEGGALPRAHALRVFADALRSMPGAWLAYSDEDQCDGEGPVTDPWFKPKFSPLLIAQGVLLGRMVALRSDGQGLKSLLGILCADADCAAFVRRYALEAGEERVVHIPHVLFHDALMPSPPLPMNWTLPASLPMVSLVIPTKDRWDLLGPCLESLRRSDWPVEKMETIVVDNGSTEQTTLQMLAHAERMGHIRVLRDERQFNWSRLNNLAAKDTRGEVLVFLNNDTEVADPAWLKKLVVQALRPDAGAVGCKLLYADRTVQHGGVIAGIQGVAGHAHLFLQSDEGGYRNLATITHEVSAVTGACLAVTRENFDAAGGFDENFRVAFNDVVFCFTLQSLGKRNVYVSDPLLIHYESKSRGYDDTPEKLALQQSEARKAWNIHAKVMRDDPFYSPNLSLWAPYELSFAPRRRAAWDDRSKRPLRVMMLSVTHAVGHGVAVVVALQADAFVRHGYEVIVAGPCTSNDFPYAGCERVEIHDSLSAATLAAQRSVDVIIAHTPPFFSVARWTGAHPPVLAYDYGEPPSEWFPDEASRRATLAEKDQSLTMATAVYAISDAVAAESRTPVDGVIPLGNAHLGQWNEASFIRREKVRAARGWADHFVILNVCRFHRGERRYKGVDIYADVKDALQTLRPELSSKAIFVLCGKGSPDDVTAMTARGLTVAANVTDEEMVDLYCAADAYANFSQWEGYNLGIGQALAMGLPTIASAIPAHRAFGIDVTDNVGEAAEWIAKIAGETRLRAPRLWNWEGSLSELIEKVEAVCGNSNAEAINPLIWKRA